MSNLLVVESPIKGHTIQTILRQAQPREGWVVVPTKGHILNLSKLGYGPFFFSTHLEPLPKSAKTLHRILYLVKKAEKIYIGTDLDREGEAIAWHLAFKILALDKNKPIFRVRYNEITKEAILKSVNNPEPFDFNLYEAQTTRRLIDRIVGFSYSKILHKLFKSRKLSAGRVQSAVLGILCKREDKIASFKKEPYYLVKGKLSDGTTIASKRIKSKEKANRLIKNCDKIRLFYSEGLRMLYPPRPFNTATLLSQASKKLGLPSKRIMSLAQHLFQRGLITYVRTTNTSINRKFAFVVCSHINKIVKGYAEQPNYTSPTNLPHEGIRITTLKPASSLKLSQDEQNLYQLIYVRTLASQAIPAKLSKQTIVGTLNEKEVLFSEGAKVIHDGWLRFGMGIFTYRFNGLSNIATLDKTSLVKSKEYTKPPNRYGESSLIDRMKKKKIGRPSTYIYSIERLNTVGYTKKEKSGVLSPSSNGLVVYHFLKNYVPKLLDLQTTAEMEKNLDKIEKGLIDPRVLLRQCYQDAVEKAEIFKKIKYLSVDKKCKLCNLPLHIVSKNNKFVQECGNCDSSFRLEPEQLSRINTLENILED